MAQSNDSENASDILTIVNRSKEYKISKQLICSKIPYFRKMCSSNSMESTDGKVVVDLDGKAFESLINWAKSGFLDLNMSAVIQLYHCSVYLMIGHIKKLCFDFFLNNFNVRYTLQNVLIGANENSCFLSAQFFSFLSRSFNNIKASPTFTELPFETVHYLCQVDACVKSEREIFDAFKLWINKKKNNATIDQLNLLMKTIRWPYVSPDDLKSFKYSYKSLGGNHKDFTKISTCRSVDLEDRRVEDHLLAIFSVGCGEIELYYFFASVWTSLGVFKKDDKLSLSLYSDHKFKTDIIYESGRSGIRIDWLNKKYRYLDIMGSPSPYYKQLFRHLLFLKEPNMLFSNQRIRLRSNKNLSRSAALVNYNGVFCPLSINGVFDYKPSYEALTNLSFGDFKCTAAISSRLIAIIKSNDPTSLKIYWTGCNSYGTIPLVFFNDQHTRFNDLQLTIHDEAIFVINKRSKEICIYKNENSQYKLTLQHKIINENDLITVTSASIPKAFLSD